MKVESLHIYPVKGLRAVNLQAATAERRGFAHDRRWMLVDEAGKFITQREQPKLATLAAKGTENGLRITGAPGTIEIARPANSAPRVPVTLWRQQIEGHAASAEADAW